jgi:hypothetical protein
LLGTNTLAYLAHSKMKGYEYDPWSLCLCNQAYLAKTNVSFDKRSS